MHDRNELFKNNLRKATYAWKRIIELRLNGVGGRKIITGAAARITDGEVKSVEGELSKSLLENNICYLLDCDAEIFVWFGRVTQVEERKATCQEAKDFVASQKRPKSTRITRLIQSYETHSFKSNFNSWPSGSATTSAEEGRGKVAALPKQQGMGVKGVAKSTPVNDAGSYTRRVSSSVDM